MVGPDAIVFVVAAVVGVGIGVLSGLLGVGGGTIMVPVFRLAFGLPPVGATGTSLFTIIPTSVTGTVAHIRNKTCIVKLGLLMGVGGAITSPLGVWLAHLSPGWTVMVATAIVIAYSSFTMLKKALKAPKRNADTHAGTPSPDAAQSAPQPDAFRFEMTPPSVAKALCIGVVTGVVSGYVGLGGGFVMVPLMLSLYQLPMRQASGTSLVAIMILALPGTVLQCLLGNVDYLVGIATACGSIPGALIGARLVSRVPERALRFTFAAFLGVAAILLVVKEAGVLG